jgi:hypothetical protein
MIGDSSFSVPALTADRPLGNRAERLCVEIARPTPRGGRNAEPCSTRRPLPFLCRSIKQSGKIVPSPAVAADPSEVARWAFGFGQDAKIVARPAAVRIARDMAHTIAVQRETEALT